MVTISLCMIVKNEEAVLGRCLQSVQNLVDEIIIVDTGSTDKTKEIAETFTDKIYDFPWIDDFAAARNFSFSKATQDFIFWLDADDVILPKDQEAFKEFKKDLTLDTQMVMLKYNVAFDTKGNPTSSFYRERLFLRSMNVQWIGAIHEVIPPFGNLMYVDIAISHKKLERVDPKRNLRIFEKMLERGETLDPRQEFYYARELYYNHRYPESIQRFEEFLDSGKGWVENCINACRDLAICYNLIGEAKKALQALCRSFAFDVPRAEICCDIGSHFLNEKQYLIAIYWYKQALACELNLKKGGFFAPECYNYVPNMQLCVLYDQLGDRKKAREYNELALKEKPEDPAALHNKKYFDSLEEKRKEFLEFGSKNPLNGE